MNKSFNTENCPDILDPKYNEIAAYRDQWKRTAVRLMADNSKNLDRIAELEDECNRLRIENHKLLLKELNSD